MVVNTLTVGADCEAEDAIRWRLSTALAGGGRFSGHRCFLFSGGRVSRPLAVTRDLVPELRCPAIHAKIAYRCIEVLAIDAAFCNDSEAGRKSTGLTMNPSYLRIM